MSAAVGLCEEPLLDTRQGFEVLPDFRTLT